jgi:O-antigen/teichoic acid export membrane protein
MAVVVGRSVWVGLERAGWVPRYEIGFRLAEAAVGTALLAAGAGVVALAAVHAASWSLEAVAVRRRFARDLPFRLRGRIDRRFLRRLAASSAVVALGAWGLMAHQQAGTILLPEIGASAAAVGHFGVVMQILTVLILLPVTFGRAVVPAVSRGYRTGSGALATLMLAVRLAAAAGLAVAAATAAGGPALLGLGLGEDYRRSGEILAVAIWSLPAWALFLILVQALWGLRARGPAALVSLGVLAGFVGLSVALQPWLAPEWAACAALIASATVGFVFAALLVERRIRSGETWLWLRVPVATAFVAGLWALLPADPWLSAPALLGAAAVAAGALRLVRPGDLQAVRRRLSRAGLARGAAARP